MFNIQFKKEKLKVLKQEKEYRDRVGFIEIKHINTIDKTKKGEYVLVSYPEDCSGDLIIIRLTCLIRNKKIQLRMNLLFESPRMKIADIIILGDNVQNQGYGSKMMETAIYLAKKRGMKLIYGDMAYDNQNHRKRQVGFYTKHGFNIENDKIKMLLAQ